MSKTKKMVLIIISSVAGLLLVINCVLMAFMIWTMNDISANPYSYYPILKPSGNYISIDDVKYVEVDSVVADAAKAGSIRVYSEDEILAMQREQ